MQVQNCLVSASDYTNNRLVDEFCQNSPEELTVRVRGSSGSRTIARRLTFCGAQDLLDIETGLPIMKH